MIQLDDMIAAMKKDLDAHEAGPDLRNKSLYFLRASKKRLHRAGNIKNMISGFIDAKERFDVFWNEREI
ncbi:MAG: hypothetical protein DSY90_14080 [Deltaproteobacteria bacterium]|nr:MAG: hypothetical protein DSY90_14080 [Deltaproteobacteria bacterium]